MASEVLQVAPGDNEREVLLDDGRKLSVPQEWSLLPPGDAALSRRVKAEGACWVVSEQRGRKRFSRGVWAPTERIERLRAEVEVERLDPGYQRKLDASRARRERAQAVYAGDFEAAVLGYLNFAPTHLALARVLAERIARHAVPVGSGTVARTQRIPIERRAEAATLAWMRHQTTAYDNMKIPRDKGMRREVRRMLASRSKELLHSYRAGRPVESESCPLQRAVRNAPPELGRPG